ncbi:MAG TPA: phosphatidate cytidylyltransferase [Acidobacteriaceae bacterium]|jgi:phosphatidate cytidylyltransferase
MQRILTAIVLIPLVLLLIFVSPKWPLLFMAVVFAVAALALWEYLGLADALGAKTPRIMVIVCLAILYAAIFRRPDLMAPFTGALALVIFVICAFRSPVNRVLVDAAFSVFGLLYIGLSLSTLYLLSTQDNGPSLLLFLVLVVWSGDIAALYIGRAFGRWKLAPTLSPNKTWEGSFASVAGSILIIILLIYISRVLSGHDIATLSYPGNPGIWISYAVLVNVAAQLGDLVESAIKRGAGVKDSGYLLPGHGGMLDRIDALLLAAPVLWYAQLAQQSF